MYSSSYKRKTFCSERVQNSPRPGWWNQLGPFVLAWWQWWWRRQQCGCWTSGVSISRRWRCLVIKVSIGINCPKLLLVGGEGESYLYLAYFVEKLTGDSGLGAIIAWRGGQGDLAGWCPGCPGPSAHWGCSGPRPPPAPSHAPSTRYAVRAGVCPLAPPVTEDLYGRQSACCCVNKFLVGSVESDLWDQLSSCQYVKTTSLSLLSQTGHWWSIWWDKCIFT